jgi:RNA polymerase sigma-70 factor (ECF subfamily)
MDGTVTTLPNEAAVIAQARSEPAAFAAIYDHYFPRIYNYVRYRVNEAQAADDLAAVIFERALLHLDRYRPERAPFAVWLFAIARNAVNDHLRAQARRRWFPLDFFGEHPSTEARPEEVLLQREQSAELSRALSRLQDRERDLLGLKFAVGLTNRRIASLTGLSESNVGVIVYRAVRRLRAELAAGERRDGERA